MAHQSCRRIQGLCRMLPLALILCSPASFVVGSELKSQASPPSTNDRSQSDPQVKAGTRSITGDTALRLAHFFGTSAQFWLNLQSLYDLRLAQEKVGKSIKALPTLKRRELVHA